MKNPKNRLIRILIPSILIVIWFAVAGIGGPYFGKINEVASNDQATFLPASAESTKVNNEIKKFQDQSTIPTIVVFKDGDSKLKPDTIANIKEVTGEISNVTGVVGEVSPPIVSEDEMAAIVVINLASDAEYRDVVPEIKNVIEKANLSIDYKVSGPVGFLNDLSAAFSGIDGLLLVVALAVVFVILLIVYRSPILPFVVLINSMFALCASILVVFYLAKYGVVTLNGQIQGILFILVIGAATDYALLFVSRYKEELKRHKEASKALFVSWKRSVEPIVAAGGTVIAGLLCLLLSDLNSNKALGPVGAIGIAMAIIATMTLLPSLLTVFGRKVFWPLIPKYQTPVDSKESPNKQLIWQKVANLVKNHSRKVWVTTTVALLIMVLGITQLKADGVPQSDFILGQSDARDGQKIIDEHFPGGSGAPTQIIISSEKVSAAVSVLEADSGVASVSAVANNSSSGTIPLGQEEERIRQQIYDAASKDLSEQKSDIYSQLIGEMAGTPMAAIEQAYNKIISNLPTAESIVENAYPFKDSTVKIVDGEVLLQATLRDNVDSNAAQDSVERIRSSLRSIDSSSIVGGISAIQLDTRISAEHDRAIVIPAVLIVITIILMLLLRSIFAPVILLATTMLSFAAILGVSAIVFNDLLQFPGADPSVVLFGFVFLVALGIDYNIFLMTRVREESLNVGTKKGILIGLIATGSVITSAGIVLAATFAALVVIPILFLVQLAFIVAFGVLLDTIVVRSLLVPAIAHDIGKNVWWPSKNHKD